MTVDKVVCERWNVKEGVGKMVFDQGVCEAGGGGGRRRRRTGIQNQKQEPHTMLWGKNTAKSTL